MPNLYKGQQFAYSEEERQQYADPEFAKQFFKDYKTRSKTQPPRLLTDNEVKACAGYYSFAPKEKNYFVQAEADRMGGNYTSFEAVPAGAAAYACTVFFHNLRRQKGDANIDIRNEEFNKFAMENRMNPYFRLAMEMAANTPDLEPAELRARCGEIATAMNEKIMTDTLAPPTEQQKLNLMRTMKPAEAERALQNNAVAQNTMAKMMFMAHLGKLHTVDQEGVNEEYTGSMTEVLAHGGRVMFNFAKGEPGNNTVERMVFHDHQTGKSVVAGRFAATHTVKAVEDEGAGAYQEKSSKGSLVQNYAMNPAIGGIGNEFCNKVIVNGGEDGHCYIKMGESTANQAGYMMWGIESAESRATGKTGRMHGTSGSGLASAFIAGKTVPGAKLGGRVVDLSCWNHQTLNAILAAFDEKYSELQTLAKEDDNALERLNTVNKSLAGKAMQSPEAMLGFMKNQLGVEQIAVGDKTFRVEDIVEHRTLQGNKSFDQLNMRNRQKAHLTVKDTFADFSDRLDRTKKTVLGVSVKDSDLMQNVKRSLDNVLLILDDPDRDDNALHTQMKDLRDFAKDYLDNRSANNERRQLVQEVFRMAQQQLPENERLPETKAPEAPARK